MTINELTDEARRLAQSDARDMVDYYEREDDEWERASQTWEAFAITRAAELLKIAESAK